MKKKNTTSDYNRNQRIYYENKQILITIRKVECPIGDYFCVEWCIQQFTEKYIKQCKCVCVNQNFEYGSSGERDSTRGI